MSEIPLYLFDPSGLHSPALPGTHSLGVRLTDVTLAELLSRGQDSQPSEVLAVAATGCQPDPETFPPAAASFLAGSADFGILVRGPRTDLAWVWDRFPADMASLIAPPEDSGTILIRQTALARLASQHASSTLHAALIQATAGHPDSVARWTAPATGPQSPLPPTDTDLPHLAPGKPVREWLRTPLSQWNPAGRCDPAADPAEVTALHSGLWQIHDFPDQSHSLSQSVEGEGRDRSGDYWHGIMHRREPDYGNAKYWFRHVGRHPCFLPLAAVADAAFSQNTADPELNGWHRRLRASGGWDALAFVDFCQAAAREQHPVLRPLAERIQWAEMLLLLEHGWQAIAARR